MVKPIWYDTGVQVVKPLPSLLGAYLAKCYKQKATMQIDNGVIIVRNEYIHCSCIVFINKLATSELELW